MRKSEPAACLHVRYVGFVRGLKLNRSRKNEVDIPTFKTVSGLSSNDGGGLDPLPARSDGLDNIDGGPDAAFYIQMRVIEQVSIRRRF
jgi:hypothetical protein